MIYTVAHCLDNEATGTILSLKVPAGTMVTAGQEILELETDKAAFTVEAPVDGTLVRWFVAPDEMHRGDDPLFEIATD